MALPSSPPNALAALAADRRPLAERLQTLDLACWSAQTNERASARCLARRQAWQAGVVAGRAP